MKWGEEDVNGLNQSMKSIDEPTSRVFHMKRGRGGGIGESKRKKTRTNKSQCSGIHEKTEKVGGEMRGEQQRRERVSINRAQLIAYAQDIDEIHREKKSRGHGVNGWCYGSTTYRFLCAKGNDTL